MILLFKEVIEMLDGFLPFPPLTSYQEVKPEFEPRVPFQIHHTRLCGGKSSDGKSTNAVFPSCLKKKKISWENFFFNSCFCLQK